MACQQVLCSEKERRVPILAMTTHSYFIRLKKQVIKISTLNTLNFKKTSEIQFIKTIGVLKSVSTVEIKSILQILKYYLTFLKET
jgi:hypothetical protein